MLFKPATKQLFSDDGTFIKKLHCPNNVQWSNLSQKDGTKNRICSICQRDIFETIDYTDSQIIDLVHKDPTVCLKISPDQPNLKVLLHHDK